MSLSVTQLIGFGAFVGSNTTGAQIAQATGTKIGNLTVFDDMSFAWNGTDTGTNGSNAAASSGAATTGYIGKTYSPAKYISQGKIYGESGSLGLVGGGASPNIYLYGKTGSAPASGTDGTVLGQSLGFTDSTGVVITLTSSNEGPWDHVWFYLSNFTGGCQCAEVKLYE